MAIHGMSANSRTWKIGRRCGRVERSCPLSSIWRNGNWPCRAIRLTASTKSQMWTPMKLNDGQNSAYGFGWQLDGFPSRIMRETWAFGPAPTTRVPMIRHGGTIPGFRAYYCRWPNHGLTVIVLTNLEDAVLDGL